MNKFQMLIEALEALDLLNQLISADSEKYIDCEKIREHLEKAHAEILKLYDELTSDSGANDH